MTKENDENSLKDIIKSIEPFVPLFKDIVDKLAASQVPRQKHERDLRKLDYYYSLFLVFGLITALGILGYLNIIESIMVGVLIGIIIGYFFGTIVIRK